MSPADVFRSVVVISLAVFFYSALSIMVTRFDLNCGEVFILLLAPVSLQLLCLRGLIDEIFPD